MKTLFDRIQPGAPSGDQLQRITRRELLGRAVGAAATLVVSQSLIACASDGITDDGDDGTVGCVLTAALTEGPYFVDERLNRSDIRSDPVTGAVSQGVPLDLTFNVARAESNACMPLTGAYLDVWHCDTAGVYSDVGRWGRTQVSPGLPDHRRFGSRSVYDGVSWLVYRACGPRPLQAPNHRRLDHDLRVHLAVLLQRVGDRCRSCAEPIQHERAPRSAQHDRWHLQQPLIVGTAGADTPGHAKRSWLRRRNRSRRASRMTPARIT